ncbi:hypothetical protein GX586_02385 [bacterium]|nr:hypothetical protein [bacterium]
MKSAAASMRAFSAVLALAGAACAAEEQQAFSALIIDQQDVTTHVRNVTFRPDAVNQGIAQPGTLSGWRGYAEVTIPWQKIRRIDLLVIDQRYNAWVTMRDATRMPLRIEAANTSYMGTNDYGGVYVISTARVRSIIFDEPEK